MPWIPPPIDLCLSLFPWATFRRAKAAIKLHTLLTLQGNFPTVIIITPGSVHDVNVLDQMVWEAGSFYIMDRGYLDFARLCPAAPMLRFLRHPDQEKLPLCPPLLPSSG